MIIINLRGANGSGKTFTAEGLLTEPVAIIELLQYITPAGRPRVVPGHLGADKVLLVGKYEKGKCGGCDTIKTQDMIRSAVKAAADMSQGEVVLFEGVIVSTIFKSYLDFAQQIKRLGHQYCWAYLNTPLEVCLQRIKERNKGRPVKEKLVADTVKSISSTRFKAKQVGEWVEVLDWRDPVNQLRGIINDHQR